MMAMFDQDLDPRVVDARDELWAWGEWEARGADDEEFLAREARTHPELDLRGEVVKFIAWVDEYRVKHPRKDLRLRARLSRWFGNAQRFNKKSSSYLIAGEHHGGSGLSEW